MTHGFTLDAKGMKMSKSLGNFFTVRDLLDQGVPGEVIRMVFLGTHYRKPMDWTEKKREEAEATLRKISLFLGSDPLTKPWINRQVAKPPEEFIEALANDLNTSLALTLLGKYLKDGREGPLLASLRLLGFVPELIVEKFASFQYSTRQNELGSSQRLVSFGEDAIGLDDLLTALGSRLNTLRANAMETKDFSAVDLLKSALVAAGVEVKMSKDGVDLTPGKGFDLAKLEAIDLP